MKKNVLIAALAATGLFSAAYADGFSATLETPVTFTNPTQFSVGGSLNYSYEVIQNLFVGGSVGGAYNFSSNVGAVGARVGGVYVAQLIDQPNTFVNAYIGAGLNARYLIATTSGLAFAGDVNGGLFARYGISPSVRVYGGADGAVNYIVTGNTVVPEISGYAGVRFEPATNLLVYVQGGVGYNNIRAANASGSSLAALPAANIGFVYDVRAGLYYQFSPQFQLGTYASYNGGFTIGLTAKFIEKPGTLGIAGNYLP